MIEYIFGKVIEIDGNRVVVEVNNVGYSLLIPLREVSHLETNREYKIYVYKYVRDDGEELYGFLEKESKRLFVALMNVTTVGPKLALKVLSYLSPSEIVKAIASDNPGAISSVKGVGDKIAERIVTELKDTVTKLGIDMTREETNFNDLVKALRGLGYNQNEILFAINSAKKQNPRLLSLDVSSAIQLCLKALRTIK